MKTTTIYMSIYGATKQYATWISDALRADLYEAKTLKNIPIEAYDCIIYGGGLYAGGIAGIKSLLKHNYKQLIVFTVGLSNTESTDYHEIITRSLPQSQLETIKIFHFRGDMDYKKLSFAHRTMMSMLHKIVQGKIKKQETISHEDHIFLETYGQQVDFKDIRSIKPLIDYVRSQS